MNDPPYNGNDPANYDGYYENPKEIGNTHGLIQKNNSRNPQIKGSHSEKPHKRNRNPLNRDGIFQIQNKGDEFEDEEIEEGKPIPQF